MTDRQINSSGGFSTVGKVCNRPRTGDRGTSIEVFWASSAGCRMIEEGRSVGRNSFRVGSQPGALGHRRHQANQSAVSQVPEARQAFVPTLVVLEVQAFQVLAAFTAAVRHGEGRHGIVTDTFAVDDGTAARRRRRRGASCSEAEGARTNLADSCLAFS